MRKNNIRIVHQDSVMVLPNGEVRIFDGEIQNYYLLVINKNEFSVEAITQLIESGYYRRRMCNPEWLQYRIDFFQNASADQSEAEYRLNRYLYGKLTPNTVENVIERFYAADSKDDKRQIMEEYYNRKLATLDLADIAERAKKKVSSAYSARNMFDKLRIYINSESDRLLSRCYKRILKYICDRTNIIEIITSKIPTERDDHDKHKNDIVEYLNSLPKIVRLFLKQQETQFIATENIDYLLAGPHRKGSRLAGASFKRLNSIAILNDEDRSTFDEEVIHLLDEQLGFSKRQDWQEAIKIDLEPEGKMESLRMLSGIFSKADIRDESFYAAEKLASEFLAEMFIADRACKEHPNSEVLKVLIVLFKNTYPIYLEFLEEIRLKVRSMKHIDYVFSDEEITMERQNMNWTARINAETRDSQEPKNAPPNR